MTDLAVEYASESCNKSASILMTDLKSLQRCGGDGEVEAKAVWLCSERLRLSLADLAELLINLLDVRIIDI
ncbi:hypothetical protein HLB42_07750 [Deinococcus sp. D7000]|nr:hypothetical protein HLB42_07750 [Deinococcus sp. D7000]